jgi:putative two-component system response regulator
VPYLDGFEMLETLRTDPATRDIPVIVLTGRGDDETYSRARELGAAQLLTKPVARDLLMKAIDGELNSDTPQPGK